MDYEIERIRKNFKNKKKNKKKEFKVKNRWKIFLSRVLVAVIFLLIALIFFKSNPELKQKFYNKVFDSHLSFASIQEWYKKKFGSPLPIVSSDVEPVFNEKISYSSKEAYMDGVKLVVSSNYLVPTLESGMIVFVGEKEGYGNTVVIEQVNGIDVWYTNISSNVSVYDYIEKGEVLGEAVGNNLIMVFKKNGETLNYEEYI